jgi:hypothetical protein
MISEDLVFRKDSNTHQDKNQTIGNLHSVPGENLRLFAEHDTCKRDHIADNPYDERRYKDGSPDTPKLTPTARALILVARESPTRGMNRNISVFASSSSP